MNDYLDFFEHYKDFKEIADLINEVNQLREWYYTRQYDRMQQHINELAGKYLIETLAWNTSYPSMPTTVQQSYINAESFLRLKDFSLLLKNGVNLQERLSAEEMAFIESTIKTIE